MLDIEKNFNLPVNNKKRIVIVGVGFAGLKLAHKLGNSAFQVVVIDKQNFHQFQPLFYQVATSGIEPSSISFPIRRSFHQFSNVHFRTTDLLEVNTEDKWIETSNGRLRYDKLVISTGVNTNYFGMKNVEKYSIPMKRTAEAIRLRNRILDSFEKAILTEDPEEQQRLLTFGIVGGGPTGVELSGAIAELRNYVLPKDYPELDFSKMQIMLFEASDKLLAAMSEKAQKDALKFVSKLGVDVRFGARIIDYDGEVISFADEDAVPCKNLIWAAGIAGEPIKGMPDFTKGPAGRIRVNKVSQVIDVDGVYALGDISYMETEDYPRGHPQVAQVAIQQALLLSKNIKKDETKEFRYFDKGSMATIGRNMAVVQLPGFYFAGFFAWLTWLFIHLMAIVGVKNRMFIFINWAQSYLQRNQSLRIMIKPFAERHEVKKG